MAKLWEMGWIMLIAAAILFTFQTLCMETSNADPRTTIRINASQSH